MLCSALIEHYPLSSGERFRPWLILSLAACLASLFLLRQIDPVHDVILLFLACFLLGAMGVFFGCATLGLSCLILPWQWRGFGGVIQTVAARAGKMLGGGLVLWLYHRYGWTAAVDFLLGSSLLLAAQLLFWRERRIAPANPLPFALLFRRFFAYWREPGHGVSWLFLLFAIAAPYAAVAATFVPRLHDLGYQGEEIGQILAVYLPVACMLATPLAGWLTRRYARITLLRCLLGLQIPLLAAFAGQAELVQLHPALPGLHIIIVSVGYTLLLPVVLALMMDKSAPATATLDSSLQFSVLLAGTYTAGFIALRVAGSYGYGAVYLGAATFAALLCLALHGDRY